MSNPINPVHFSLYELLKKGYRVRPREMTKLSVPRELSYGVTQIALDIFTDCTNVGVPFQDAICAVYLSGLEHGHQITTEKLGNQ